MSNFKVGRSRFSRFINGKGFYIALALCLVAIGSAAYIAANKSLGNVSNLTSETKSGSGTQSSSSNYYKWPYSGDTQQTGNTISGVTGSNPSSSSSSSSPSSSAPSSSSSASSKPSSSSSTASVPKTAPTLYVLPVEGSVLTKFSSDTPIYNKTMDDYRVHDGVDISANLGTAVKACADGVVADIRVDDMLGQQVLIQHGGGIMSVYSNLTNQVSVKKGQAVETGQVIGAVGQTAVGEISLVPHLHYAMLKNGKYVDPFITMGKSE